MGTGHFMGSGKLAVSYFTPRHCHHGDWPFYEQRELGCALTHNRTLSSWGLAILWAVGTWLCHISHQGILIIGTCHFMGNETLVVHYFIPRHSHHGDWRFYEQREVGCALTHNRALSAWGLAILWAAGSWLCFNS